MFWWHVITDSCIPRRPFGVVWAAEPNEHSASNQSHMAVGSCNIIAIWCCGKPASSIAAFKQHYDVIYNGTFSSLLALCEGNSPVTGEFPSQRPVTRSCGIFFDLCLKKNGWVNNRDANDLRRHRAHYDVTVMKTALPLTENGCDNVISWQMHHAVQIAKPP